MLYSTSMDEASLLCSVPLPFPPIPLTLQDVLAKISDRDQKDQVDKDQLVTVNSGMQWAGKLTFRI